MQTRKQLFAWTADGDHRWRDYEHSAACLVWFKSGSAIVEANRTWRTRLQHRMDASAGQLCLFTRGDYFEIKGIGGLRSGLALRIEADDIAATLSQEDSLPDLLLLRPAFNDSQLVRSLAQLWHAQKDGEGMSVLKTARRSIVQRLLESEGRLPRQRSERKFSASVRRQIEEAILESLDSGMDGDRLAALLGISPSHFDRMFRNTFAMSLHQFVIAARVREAAKQLRRDAQSMQDIGAGLGFSTPAHFTSTFRRIMGVTPTQYRAGVT